MNLKQSFKSFFTREPFGHLMNVSKNFHVLSIGLDEIMNGTKNANEMKKSVMHLIYIVINALILFMFLISDKLYSFYEFEYLTDQFRVIIFDVLLVSAFVIMVKIDLILGELKCNLRPLKIIYFLVNNLKEKHKLNQKNYNRLVLSLQMFQFLFMDYGGAVTLILILVFNTAMSIWSRKLIWIIEAIKLTPFYLIEVVTLSTWMCSVYVLVSYYKFRFNQINDGFKLILSNDSLFSMNRKREMKLMHLVKEHNRVSSEVNQFNMMNRRSTATMFLILSLIKIVSLYLIINIKDVLTKVVVTNVFIMAFMFGFGLSYLFSMQIISAHQSHKQVYLILSNYKMKPFIRLKVNLIS